MSITFILSAFITYTLPLLLVVFNFKEVSLEQSSKSICSLGEMLHQGFRNTCLKFFFPVIGSNGVWFTRLHLIIQKGVSVLLLVLLVCFCLKIQQNLQILGVAFFWCHICVLITYNNMCKNQCFYQYYTIYVLLVQLLYQQKHQFLHILLFHVSVL